MAVQLYKTCVMPAVEYGVGLWGAGSYNSAAWLRVEAFWRMAARTVLKLPLRTPSEALLGDLGWHKFSVRGAWQAVCLWTRVTRKNEYELARKAMHVQCDMFAKKNKCWLTTLYPTLTATDFGKDIWQQWWNAPSFSVPCERKCVDSGGKTVIRSWSDDMKEIFTAS